MSSSSSASKPTDTSTKSTLDPNPASSSDKQTSSSPSAKTTMLQDIIHGGTAVVEGVAARVDPYVPQLAKDAAALGLNTAHYITDTAISTATGIKDRAVSTATGALKYTTDTATWVFTGATTTVTTLTPGPIRELISKALTGAQALKDDPASVLNVVKPYVPRFVINVGEKTYEVVLNTSQKTKEGIESTRQTYKDAVESSTQKAKERFEGVGGYIVTKVNGTVEYMHSIPQVHTLIEKLEALAEPVLKRAKEGQEISGAAVGNAAGAVADVVGNMTDTSIKDADDVKRQLSSGASAQRAASKVEE
ncbi:hypothetical protein HDV05_007338 [Chytridiales sp. JEL 0842]|nr:hypothetical protein HDV05_007338 [Chytridiales sp. JEL 0842]